MINFLKSSTNTFSYAWFGLCFSFFRDSFLRSIMLSWPNLRSTNKDSRDQSGQVLRYCQRYLIGYHIPIGYPIPDFEKGNCYLIEYLLPEIVNDTCLSYDIAFEMTIIGFENYWFELYTRFSINWPKLFKIYHAIFILQLLKVRRCQNLALLFHIAFVFTFSNGYSQIECLSK